MVFQNRAIINITLYSTGFDDSDDSSSNSEDDPTFVVEDQRKETSKNKLEVSSTKFLLLSNKY